MSKTSKLHDDYVGITADKEFLNLLSGLSSSSIDVVFHCMTLLKRNINVSSGGFIERMIVEIDWESLGIKIHTQKKVRGELKKIGFMKAVGRKNRSLINPAYINPFIPEDQQYVAKIFSDTFKVNKK